MARVGGIVAPLMTMTDEYFPWLPPVAYGAAPVASGLIAMFLPETLNVPLPDTIEEVENRLVWGLGIGVTNVVPQYIGWMAGWMAGWMGCMDRQADRERKREVYGDAEWGKLLFHVPLLLCPPQKVQKEDNNEGNQGDDPIAEPGQSAIQRDLLRAPATQCLPDPPAVGGFK